MIKEITTKAERKKLFRLRLQRAILNKRRKGNPLTDERFPDKSKIIH